MWAGRQTIGEGGVKNVFLIITSYRYTQVVRCVYLSGVNRSDADLLCAAKGFFGYVVTDCFTPFFCSYLCFARKRV